MRQLTLIAILICYILGLSVAQAQTHAKENEQAEENYRKADRELMEVYQKVLKSYADDSVFIAYFMESEKCWIRFRDAQVNMKFPHMQETTMAAPNPCVFITTPSN